MKESQAYTSSHAVYVSLESDRKESKFSIQCFRQMADLIKDYLLIFPNVILIFYYDSVDIHIASRRVKSGINPQHFRSMLFNTLMDRYFDADYCKSNLTIDDSEVGGHYSTLLTKVKNINEMVELEKSIMNHNTK